MEVLTDEFVVVADNGHRSRIREYAKKIDAGHMLEPDAVIYGSLRRLVSDEGNPCERIDEDTFKILPLGQIVRREVPKNQA
jgi:hypothetical protein